MTNLSEVTEAYKREALRLIKDIETELNASTEFKNPSLNYMSTIRFAVEEALQVVAGKITVANREERKWATSPLNPNREDS